MKLQYFLFTFLLLGIVSCSDDNDSYISDKNIYQDSTNYKISDDEIYYIQIDKERILNRLIMFDKSKMKYVLDLSDKDATELGISKETYNDAKKRVDLMNGTNITHQ